MCSALALHVLVFMWQVVTLFCGKNFVSGTSNCLKKVYLESVWVRCGAVEVTQRILGKFRSQNPYRLQCFIKHRPTLLDSFGHPVKHRPTLFHPTMLDDVLRCFTRLDGA